MDIISEIDRLPQYYYMLKNMEIILGGNSGFYDRDDDKANDHRSSIDRLNYFWQEIKNIMKKMEKKEF